MRPLFLLALCVTVSAQQAVFHDIHINKKQGHRTGVAVVTVKGKTKIISKNALQAWPIMDAQNALVLVLAAKDKKDEYHLRFIEGATRKRRDLGLVPFATAELLEQKQGDGTWALVLSGNSGAIPVILVADTDGIHGRLEGASSAKLEPGILTYKDTRDGMDKRPQLSVLLGKELPGIYEAPSKVSGKPA